MSDLPPSDEELKAAQALAKDLERHVPTGGAHDDALATALMIRNSVDDELDELGLARSKPKQRESMLPTVLFRAVGFAAAAAVIAGISFMAHEALTPVASNNPMDSPSRHPVDVRPRQAKALDSTDVIHAQSAAIAKHDPAELDASMREYRGRMLAALESQYGGSP
ncbi:MAG: hypothetical protein JST54_33590 [Deltaproteobacteria bacterium]|nr:hypothetical protein [Deltaproteobacteria bacterium]